MYCKIWDCKDLFSASKFIFEYIYLLAWIFRDVYTDEGMHASRFYLGAVRINGCFQYLSFIDDGIVDPSSGSAVFTMKVINSNTWS